MSSSEPETQPRPASMHSRASQESTPLLSRQGDDERVSYNTTLPNGTSSPAAASLQSIRDNLDGNPKGGRRWATIISLSILSLLVIAILGLGFAAPAVVEEYAKEAIVVEPTSLSIDSFTTTGVRARIQGSVVLDGSRVQKKSVRDLGRAGTWIAKKIQSGKSEVKVYVPEYGNILLGTAKVPPITVDIRDGHYNHVNFLTDLEPGSLKGLRKIANDWLDGRLGSLAVKGIASVPLRSGIFKLGTQTFSQSMLLRGNDIPTLPEFDIRDLKFTEFGPPGKSMGMKALASVVIMNEYPIRFDVPPLHFDILVPNCSSEDEYLMLGQAITNTVHIMPRTQVDLNVTGMIRQLPESLTKACPGSNSSILDSLLADYLGGRDTTVFVRGSKEQDTTSPGWVTGLIKDTTVPLPLPGHPLGNLIRNFSLANVHFSLPDPYAEPNTPGANPKISAVVKALVGLPKELNFDLNVDRVRADADIFYHGKKLGKLDLHKWQPANTTKIQNGTAAPELWVESVVDEAPLKITDDDVFTDVIQKIIFGGKGAVLDLEAAVDVHTMTALGEFTVRRIPAKGKVFVKPIGRHGFPGLSGFKPQVGDLRILDTTKSSLRFSARVNVTNPSEYSAHVPYVSIHVLHNNTLLANAVAKNIDIVPGNNTDMLVEALWSPSDLGGQNGSEVGRNFLSKYISGLNTTLTLRAHESSIPSQPSLGKALSSFEVVIDTPRLFAPGQPGDDGDGDDEDGDNHAGPRFIKDATMHLISSTATFILLSPLPHTTLYITSVAATAFYNHTEPVGTIDYAYQFAVPPGASKSPNLPVQWSLGGAGYDAVRDALGGTLKLDAKADVGVRVGEWTQQVWFEGGGIGASIRL